MMLLCSLLERHSQSVENAVIELFDQANTNQRRQGDFLLTLLSAREVEGRISVGGDEMFESFITTDEFLRPYIESCISDVTNSQDFLALFDNRMVNDSRRALEHLINLQMLIYNKIWESKYFCQLICQLNKLRLSRSYDWELRFTNSGSAAISSRWEAIAGENNTFFSQNVSRSFHRQLRNEIAHSTYWFLENIINCKDLIVDSRQVTFDTWFDKFHISYLLYHHTFRQRETRLQTIWENARTNRDAVTVFLGTGFVQDALTTTDYPESWGIQSNTQTPPTSAGPPARG